MRTSLLAIAKKARERKDLRFFNLYRLIDEALLLDCWRDIRKNAAFGVDGISAEEYGENLTGNIRDLVDRLKRKTYRARLVAQSPESAPQLHAVGFRRFAQSFPCAAATDPSAEPSRITAPVFLCRCLMRKRVFLKSPVLEKGTQGSVRGRLGQLAVLPRWSLSSTIGEERKATGCTLKEGKSSYENTRRPECLQIAGRLHSRAGFRIHCHHLK